VGLAEISVAMARQKKKGLAARFYRKAEEAYRQFLPNLPRPIPIAMAQAAAASANWKEADGWMAPMSETFDRAETQSKVYAERLRGGRASPRETPPMWEPEVLEARAEWVLVHRDEVGQMRAEISKSLDVVPKMFPVDQPEAYLAIYRVARELGERELQEAAAAGAIRSSTSLARDMEDTAILQAKVAEGLFAAGDPRAALMIRSAREASDEPPGFYQPVALGAVAEAMQKMGQTESARETYTEAWKRAAAHIHPRARVVNAVKILLSQSRAGVRPTAEDLDVALAIQKGERGKPLPSGVPSQEVMEEVATHLQKLEAGKTNAPAKPQK
jgi:tetratricopeptide (TPR) repeat protein